MFSSNSAIVCAAAAALSLSSAIASAAVTYSTNFDSLTPGSINGQDGWQVTNSTIDQAVFPGTSHSSNQSWHLSNAQTSSGFGDQPLSAVLPGGNAAGESTVSGVTSNTATWSVWFKAGSTSADDSAVSISLTDNSGGSRMNYVSLNNSSAGGVTLNAYDATSNGFGNSASYNSSSLGVVDRTDWHQLTVFSTFNDGPANDVVKYYVDGSLKATIGSWEDYYRDDPEQVGNGNTLFANNRVLFRVASAAQSTPSGFYFDDFSVTTAVPEPSYLGLAGMAASALLMRRRRRA